MPAQGERDPRYPGAYYHGASWWYQIKINGQQIRKGGFETALEAYNAKTKLKEAGKPPVVPSDIRFKQYADDWLRDSRLASTSKDTYRHNLKHLKSLYLTKVKDITVFDVRRITNEMEQKRRVVGGEEIPYASLTVTGVLKCLSKIMSRAVSDGILQVNPVGQLDTDHRPKHKRAKKIRMLEREEAQHLVSVAETFGQEWKVAFLLALHAGLRKSEIINITWNRIDFPNRLIVVSPDDDHELKTEASEGVVAMSDDLFRALHAWHEETEWKFGNDYVIPTSVRTAWDRTNFGRRVKEITKAAGLEGLTLHPLRHNLATAMIHADVPDKVISLTMRHSNTHVTRTTYAHAYKERENRETAVAAVNELFGSRDSARA